MAQAILDNPESAIRQLLDRSCVLPRNHLSSIELYVRDL